MSGGLQVLPLPGLPEFGPGDSVADAIAATGVVLAGDVVVVTQKIVSKVEGRLVEVDEDDVEAKLRLALAEAKRVLRRRGDLVITETSHGFVCANSGVDLSNIASGYAALLPVDPDRSARRIRDSLRHQHGLDVAVIVSDTFGRPWRQGLTDVAIGCAGIAAVLDLRGEVDAQGRTLVATEVCIVDELASAAELVMGKAANVPVAIVRGVERAWLRDGSVAEEIVRPPGEDLFR